MGLLNRWRGSPADDDPSGGAQLAAGEHRNRAILRVLRADGQRIDLTARDAGTRLSLTRQDWQNDAWTYRDMIGELRYAHRLLARSVSKVRFYAAEIRDYPDDPAELTGSEHGLDKRLAADAVANLSRLPLDDGPDGFLASLVEQFETPGEGWIHGQPEGQSGESWTVRSTSEIAGQGDQIFLAELPGQATLGQRLIDPAKEELLRCWVRHPRWGQLADSPLRAMLDVLEEVVLTGREMRAAARSRIASNGILLVPNSLTLLRAREEDEDPERRDDDDFMVDLTEAMTAPIRNEGSPGSVVPLVLRGESDALKEVRHLTMVRADAEKLMERLNGAVLRMLQGLDIQPEQVQGLGQINHWGSWQIEASGVRHQVLPMCGIVAGCLTKAFLRPALLALDHDPDQVRRVIAWYDAGDLVESPDRRQDARDAWDRDAISDAAFREALSFSEDDAPSPEEHLLRLLSRGRLTPQAVPLVAALSGLNLTDRRIQDALAIAVGLAQRAAAPPVTRELPAGESGAHAPNANDVVPEKTTPAAPASGNPGTPPESGVTAASGIPVGWRVDLDLTRALADIDTALTDRILTAADAAVARAVERAGGRAKNKIRSHTRQDRELASQLERLDAVYVPHRVGRELLATYVSLPEMLAGASDRLREQFREWVSAAAGSIAELVTRLLGYDPATGSGIRDQLLQRLDTYQPAAWDELSRNLDRAVERALFRAQPLEVPRPETGEHSSTLITPSEVTRALTVAGGGSADRAGRGMYATGPAVVDFAAEHGGVLLGWEWRYRPQIPRGSHFGPHLALDGVRFSTWTDPKLDTTPETRELGEYFHPQDHAGCRCAAAPVIVVPDEDPDDIVGQRIRAAAASTQGRLAAQVAAQDTAAGRIGTSIQSEVEIRNRIISDIEHLRRTYVTDRTVTSI